MTLDCNSFAIPHSVHVCSFVVLHNGSPVSAPVLLLTSLFSSADSQTVSFFQSISSLAPFPSLCPCVNRASLHSSHCGISSIYSGGTILLKVEWSPWTLLFARDCIPLQFSGVINFTPTPRVPLSQAVAFKRQLVSAC